MGALALLSPRVWLELAVVAAVVGLGWWGYNAIYDRGAAHVQAQWDEQKREQLAAIAKEVDAARVKTQAVQEQSDREFERAQNEKAAINRNLTAALSELRNRPERPASGPDLPAPTSTCTGQTGASLARGDAAFLAGYAADAKRLQVALDQCEALYQAAERTVNGDK